MTNFNIFKYHISKIVSLSKKELKKRFPKLMEEIEEDPAQISIDSVRLDTERGEELSGNTVFDPSVIDFLRRCDTDLEAKEIVVFMEKRGEISKDFADELLRQIQENGVRSFGSKKGYGYYSKKNI